MADRGGDGKIMRSLTTITKLIFFIAASLSLLFLTVSCSSVTSISTDDWIDHYEPGHTREEILNDFNMHRGKWWNHYSRGCRLAEGGFWDDAVLDFKESLNVRAKDQRAARSYGMHFWDYFARRELGVSYYNVGKYDEAAIELERSLETVDSAKAKFYLNKVRTAVLAQKNMDKNAPVIKVTSFNDGDFVNLPNIELKGKIVDDYYTGAIWINNRKLFIELASNELGFDEKIKLRPGENTISIKASDLAGNQTDKTLKLNLDLRSPVILLNETPNRKSADQKTVMLEGALIDDSGIKQFWINGHEIEIERGKEVAFNENIDIPSTGKIDIKAIDIAGNEVHGEYSLEVKSSGRYFQPKDLHGFKTQLDSPLPCLFENAPDKEYPKLASVNNSLVATAITQETDQSVDTQGDSSSKSGTDSAGLPKIVSDLKPITVYEDYYVISGEVRDNAGVAKVLVNNEEIQGRSAKHLFFNHILNLNEGENQVTISAENVEGGKIGYTPTIIMKKTFEFLETDARYTVALMPLKRVGAAVGVASESVYPILMQSFENEPKRFNFVERDETKLLQVLNEQKMSNSDLASPDNVIKIGKIRSAEGMLFGTIAEDDKSLNISLNLVDTETTKVLATADVYGEDKNVDNLRWLMKGLALKIKQKFPMLQGSVVYVSKKGFFVDFGTDMGAALGMKFLIFREVDLGMMKINEPLDAVAQVVQIDKQACMAKIISGEDTINKNDLVITK